MEKAEVHRRRQDVNSLRIGSRLAQLLPRVFMEDDKCIGGFPATEAASVEDDGNTGARSRPLGEASCAVVIQVHDTHIVVPEPLDTAGERAAPIVTPVAEARSRCK
jgi:hypothetical protein